MATTKKKPAKKAPPAPQPQEDVIDRFMKLAERIRAEKAEAQADLEYAQKELESAIERVRLVELKTDGWEHLTFEQLEARMDRPLWSFQGEQGKKWKQPGKKPAPKAKPAPPAKEDPALFELGRFAQAGVNAQEAVDRHLEGGVTPAQPKNQKLTWHEWATQVEELAKLGHVRPAGDALVFYRRGMKPANAAGALRASSKLSDVRELTGAAKMEKAAAKAKAGALRSKPSGGAVPPGSKGRSRAKPTAPLSTKEEEPAKGKAKSVSLPQADAGDAESVAGGGLVERTPVLDQEPGVFNITIEELRTSTGGIVTADDLEKDPIAIHPEDPTKPVPASWVPKSKLYLGPHQQMLALVGGRIHNKGHDYYFQRVINIEDATRKGRQPVLYSDRRKDDEGPPDDCPLYDVLVKIGDYQGPPYHIFGDDSPRWRVRLPNPIHAGGGK